MDILPSVETLRQLFANNNKFRIPRFQRDYKWKFNEQIQEFWEDLFSSFQNNNKHFLGTLVLSKSDDEVSDVDVFYVVDGQQRLTTMMLLYHVIYSIASRFIEEPQSPIFNDLIDNTNNTKSAEDLKSFCSSLLWDGVKDDKYLALNEKDNADYVEILDHGLLQEKPSTNKNRLYKSHWALWEKMDEFFLSGSFPNQGVDGTLGAVLKFAKHVASKIQFLKLAATSSDVDAYILFESLNDRGQPLDPADLLKNGLLKFCNGSRDDEDQVLLNWKTIEQNLSSSRFSITDYIRFYWTAFHRETTNQKLYKEIKSHLQEGFSSPVTLSSLLRENSYFFSKITQRKQWPSSESNTKKEYYFEDINYLNYKICYPLFLKANSLSINYMDELVGGTLKFLFRMITVQERSVGLASKTMSQMIEALKNGEAEEQVLSFLKSDSEYDNEHFMSALKNREFEPSIARYILFNIDLKQQGAARGARFDQVHVEHIYPQNPSSGWADFDSRGRLEDYWKYNLGNQTLLDKQLNQSASNKSFADKIVYYKKKEGACGTGEPEEGTVFNMTFELHDAYQSGETEWTTQRILERAQSLAQQATQIW